MSKYDFLAIAVFLVLVLAVVIWASIKIISDAYELYYIVKCDKDRDMGFDDDENQS